MRGKLRGAVRARQDPALVLIGRTSALRHGGLEETLSRVKAYQDTGIDALFIVGARTREEVQAIHQATSLPLMLGGIPAALADRAFLAAHGVRIALQGHQPFYAGIKAVYETLKHLKEGGAPADLMERVAPDTLIKVALRQDDYNRWQQDYLR
jgi:carboxyvinyl-carboxyphosphonate phosphorylmutase